MLCLGLGISQSVTLLYQEVKGGGSSYRDGYTPLPVDATRVHNRITTNPCNTFYCPNDGLEPSFISLSIRFEFYNFCGGGA